MTPNLSCRWGYLSAHQARSVEHKEHFGQVRAHDCYFFIPLPQLWVGTEPRGQFHAAKGTKLQAAFVSLM